MTTPITIGVPIKMYVNEELTTIKKRLALGDKYLLEHSLNDEFPKYVNKTVRVTTSLAVSIRTSAKYHNLPINKYTCKILEKVAEWDV